MMGVNFGIVVESFVGSDDVELRCTVCAGRILTGQATPVDLAILLRAAAAHAGDQCRRDQMATELPAVGP